MTDRMYERSLKSVVLIRDRRYQNHLYCSGLVVVKVYKDNRGRKHTLVVGSSAFAAGREEHLSVCFFDGSCSPASLVSIKGAFCLLKTNEHSSCQPVKLMQEPMFSQLKPSQVFIAVPSTSSTTRYKEGYIVLESAEAYTRKFELAANSKDYLLVACNYSEKTILQSDMEAVYSSKYNLDKQGLDMLTSAPVFNSGDGQVVGVIVQDCRILYGKLVKVAMNSIVFKQQLELLLKPTQDRMGKEGIKRKRDDGSPEAARSRRSGSRAGSRPRRYSAYGH